MTSIYKCQCGHHSTEHNVTEGGCLECSCSHFSSIITPQDVTIMRLASERDAALGKAADEKHRADTAEERWKNDVLQARVARDEADKKVDILRKAVKEYFDAQDASITAGLRRQTQEPDETDPLEVLDALHRLDEARIALKNLLCDHDWIDLRNVEKGGAVESGEWCPKCGALK